MKLTSEALENIKGICDELLFGDRLKRAASQEQKMMEFAGALAEIGHTADAALLSAQRQDSDKDAAIGRFFMSLAKRNGPNSWPQLWKIQWCGNSQTREDDDSLKDWTLREAIEDDIANGAPK